jgi:hypothetical protein
MTLILIDDRRFIETNINPITKKNNIARSEKYFRSCKG